MRDFVVDDSDRCLIKINLSHKTGCNIGNLSALWEWIEKNKWVMFSICVVLGTVICFLGRTLFKPVLFITGMVLSIGLVWLIFYSTFLSSKTETWVGWVVLGGSVLLGLIIGTLFVKIVKLGAFCLGGWGGFSLGLLLWNSFLYFVESQVGFWCFTLGIGLICAILALFFFDHILIHATALSGSYLAIIGIGLVAGHYQNPFTIAEEMQKGTIDHIDPIFYAYLAGNVVLYLLGAVFQYR